MKINEQVMEVVHACMNGVELDNPRIVHLKGSGLLSEIRELESRIHFIAAAISNFPLTKDECAAVIEQEALELQRRAQGADLAEEDEEAVAA